MSVALQQTAALTGGDVDTFDRFQLAHEPVGSYQWWYFDALSDDGRFGMVAIYFVGGVFSALYADRLADGIAASPLDHPMINLVLYERGTKKAWIFSEYPRSALTVHDPLLDVSIGRSRLTRTAPGRYRLHVDDDDFPRGRHIRLDATFEAEEPGLAPPGGVLSRTGRHLWGAPAPRCRVTVRSDDLGLAWSGTGYHDVNLGAEPLHTGFRHWGWGRAHFPGETRLYYDAVEADGTPTRHLLAGREGRLEHLQMQGSSATGSTLSPWLLRLPKVEEAGSFENHPIRVSRAWLWESSPFYARWVGRFDAGPHVSHGVCEQVDLRRFASKIVRFMLRYRIYRMPGVGQPPHAPHVDWRELFADDVD